VILNEYSFSWRRRYPFATSQTLGGVAAVVLSSDVALYHTWGAMGNR
jgi:hypothetical protein